MVDRNRTDYSQLDRPEILMFLFHPRPEWGEPTVQDVADELVRLVREAVKEGA